MIWCNNVQSDCLANFAHEAAKDRTHMDELPASCHGDGMPCGVLLGPCFHSGHLLWFQCYFAGSELEGSGRRAYTNMALPGEIVQEYRLTNAPYHKAWPKIDSFIEPEKIVREDCESCERTSKILKDQTKSSRIQFQLQFWTWYPPEMW